MTSSTTHADLPSLTALKVSKLLIETVESLSNSSFPFPVPNVHPPPEILHLIYDFIANTDPEERQEVLDALSLTSKTWRQIVTERPLVYLNSLFRVQQYRLFCDAHWKLHWRQRWEELYIDLSNGHLQDSETLLEELEEIFSALCGNEPRNGRIILSLSITEDTPLGDGWGQLVQERSEEWKRLTVRISILDPSHYKQLWRILQYKPTVDGEEKEYFIGDPTWADNLETTAAQGILNGVLEPEFELVEDSDFSDDDFDSPDDEDSHRACPIFTNYTTFAVPWLVFTAPIFLLETAPERYRPTTLPPSRLRHLEITLEVDPSNPAQAIQHLDSFFSAISLKIERLAFRLRVTCPHPTPADELKFSEHIISCLLSCARLRHLEIGGFGFSPDFLSRLSVLSLSTLVLLPLQHVISYNGHIRPLFSSPSTLRQSLNSFHFEDELLRNPRDWPEISKTFESYGISLEYTHRTYPERRMYNLHVRRRGLDVVSFNHFAFINFRVPDDKELILLHLLCDSKQCAALQNDSPLGLPSSRVAKIILYSLQYLFIQLSGSDVHSLNVKHP